jgi:Glycosyl hydrolases family 16
MGPAMNKLFASVGLFVLLLVSAQGAPDLTGYKLVFDEELSGHISDKLSPGYGWGPIVAPHRFIEHTPYGGDFGNAYFTGPHEDNGDGTGKVPPSPFSLYNNYLVIKAYLDPIINHWRSGIITSVDTQGKGFSQALGYFEARMNMSRGAGVWPSFWLAGVNGINKNRTTNAAEIDVVEMYGVDMSKLHNNLHVWAPNGKQVYGTGHTSTVIDPTVGWHTYGCLVNVDLIHFYFDGNEVWNTPTPAEAKQPLYFMVDLAMGGGWPINVASPVYLKIDYVRVYAKP